MNLHRVKALAPWLAEARYVWLSVGSNLIALIVVLRPGTSEPTIRLTGLVLQCLGIATVVWGISETRALFGHPSLSLRAREWLQRCPLRSKSITLGAAGVSSATATGRLRGHVTYGPIGDPTTEARLEALEKNLGAIHERISAVQKETDDEFHKATASLESESVVRSNEDASIRSKLEATGTGGVHISAIGAAWLFVGVALSTAAPELSGLLK